MAKALVTDMERCLGCGTCVIECAMAHTNAATLAEAMYCQTPVQSRIHLEPVGEFGMPMQCRHCEDAPCIVVCPTDAIHRLSKDGPVLLVKDRCIGCRLCLFVCPFGVIEMSRAGTAMVKCDLCVERTEVGEEPACVAGCPTGALQFSDITDYLRQRRREAARQVASSSQISVSIAEKH
jgi:carbon-monoxide dehydrogenase iron sulfur subunit